MENKKSPIKVILIILLIIIFISSLGLSGYLLYDKYFKKEEITSKNNDQTEEPIEKEMDLNDSKIIDRLKLIIPHDDSGKDAYQNKKVTYKDISNKTILGSVGQLINENPDSYEKIGSSGITNDKSKCLGNNIHETDNGFECYVKDENTFSVDNWYAYKRETIAKIVKDIFGDIQYIDEDIQIYKYIGNCNYENGIYFCSYGGGDVGCPDINKEGEFIKAIKKDDEIHLYEKYILYTSELSEEESDTLNCKTNIYKYGDKSQLLAENKADDFDIYDFESKKYIQSKVFKDYKNEAITYKHIFKNDGTGNYIWISSEPLKDNK